MKTLKRLAAFLLAFMLVVSLVPTDVFATEEESSKISVTIRVRGDSIHEAGQHEAYTTWATVKLELDQGATLADAFQAALQQAGLEVTYNDWGFVGSITNSQGETLPSSYSTDNAYWMTLLNGGYTSTTDDQIVLADNDYAVYYFVDDWSEVYVADEEDEENAKNESADENVSTKPASLTDEALQDIFNATGELLLQGDAPIFGSYGGEWLVFGLARSGLITEDFITGYRENLVTALSQAESLSATDYERVIIATTALGLAPTEIIDGVDLSQPLSDYDFVTLKGISSVAYALLALDTNHYEIPTAEAEKTQTTREALIQYILDQQTAEGFWNWGYGDGLDVDLTSIAIQALAPYYDVDETVTAAVDKALAYLSDVQDENGRILGQYGESCESYAQLVVALTSLGINPTTDTRFVKNGSTILDILAEYYVAGEGFASSSSYGVNAMSTEQAFYALVAYERLVNDRTSLYDMTDLDEKAEEETPAAVAVTKVALNQTKAELVAGKQLTLKATVSPANATDKTVSYSSDNTKVATVDANGVVTAKKAGKATITVKAGNKTAKCVVTVYAKTKAVTVKAAGYNTSKLTLVAKKSVKLVSAVTPATAKQGVKYSVAKKYAKLVSVSQKGVVKAKKAGTAKITVTSADGTKKQVITVTVVKKAVTNKKLALKSAKATLKKKGATAQITVKTLTKNTTDKITYKVTSGAKYVKVDKYGKVTAKVATTKKAKQAVVTVKCGKASKKFTVTLKK